MGTDKGATVALDAGGRLPHGDAGGDAPLFIGGSTQRHGAVLVADEGGNGEVVTLLGVAGTENIADKVRDIVVLCLGGIGAVLPVLGNGHCRHMGHPLVDGGQIHLHHLFTLLGERLLGGLFHVSGGFFHGDDVCQTEERSLQHHAGMVAQTQIAGDSVGINDVQFCLLFCQTPLYFAGQLLLQLLRCPAAVQQEGAAGFQLGDDIILTQEGLVVAGHKVCLLYQIGGENGLLAEAQMAAGDAEGLLGVVLKIGLGILIGIVADDLDGILVSAHGAVAAKTPELTADHFLVGEGQAGPNGQRAVCHIIFDTHSEAGERLILQQVIENRLDLSRGGVLGGETVTAAADVGGVLAVGVGGADGQIQRIARRAHFFAAVQHRDLLHRFGQRLQEVFCGERVEQMDLQIADLFPLGVQVRHGLPGCAADRTHGHDDPGRIRSAVVVENVIISAGDGVDLLHVVFHRVRQLVIGTVIGFAELEVNVRILDGIAQRGMIRIQGRLAETAHRIPIQKLAELLIGNGPDFLDLVGGAKTIKEVQERDPTFDGRQMGHAGQVHNFLHTAGGQHGEAGLAAVHHIAVITEDGHGMGTHRAGCHMQDRRLTGAADPVHGGDHQHQALGGSERGGKGTGFQCAVDRADGAGFRLHLHQGDRLGKQVLSPIGRPLVRFLRHRRRGRNGIDGGYLGKRIGNIGCRFVAVCDHDIVLTHDIILLSVLLYYITSRCMMYTPIFVKKTAKMLHRRAGPFLQSPSAAQFHSVSCFIHDV